MASKAMMAGSMQYAAFRLISRGKPHAVLLQAQRVYPVPSSLSPQGQSSYLDIVPTKEGYNHIALFSPASNSTPRFLTSGNWEVTGGILAIDSNRSLV